MAQTEGSILQARTGSPKLTAPATWRDPGSHLATALTDPWYRMLLELTDVAQRATAQFWYERGVRAAYLPVTTGSISSPMGLGSNSTPVKVNLQGVPTYLADSMQFLLEYGCRMNEAGCWRGGTQRGSARGLYPRGSGSPR
jgi:asparaginyl-tRNA synthetase